jgi:hypothetical protein
MPTDHLRSLRSTDHLKSLRSTDHRNLGSKDHLRSLRSTDHRNLRSTDHRNLRSRTSMLAQVLQTFWAKKKPCKKAADLHPRQGNLLHWNVFTWLNKTSLHYTK